MKFQSLFKSQKNKGLSGNKWLFTSRSFDSCLSQSNIGQITVLRKSVLSLGWHPYHKIKPLVAVPTTAVCWRPGGHKPCLCLIQAIKASGQGAVISLASERLRHLLRADTQILVSPLTCLGSGLRQLSTVQQLCAAREFQQQY